MKVESKPVYEWAENVRCSGSAQIVGETLMQINEKHGTVKPETVVHEAKRKSHPLHPFFEWDNDKAADEFRKEQARYLIRSVRIIQQVKNEEPKLIRVFHNVEDTEEIGRGYQPLVHIMNSEDLKQQAISYSIQYLQQARKRLSEIKELEKIVVELEKIEAKLDAETKREVKPSKKIVGKPKGISAVP